MIKNLSKFYQVCGEITKEITKYNGDGIISKIELNNLDKIKSIFIKLNE